MHEEIVLQSKYHNNILKTLTNYWAPSTAAHCTQGIVITRMIIPP